MVADMPGQLFTHYFLTDGIKATPEWKASVDRPQTFAAFRSGVARRHEELRRSHGPNEAVTEQDLIRPVLELLGWADNLPQQGVARNEDIPDHLLFVDSASKQAAAAEPNAGDRIRHAAVVEESKRFGLSLDDRDKEDKAQARTPHGQTLRYLSTAEIESESRIRWGILTNGSVWRLYDYRARPRASGYFEADLGSLLGLRERDGEDGLRTFFLLFHRDAFTLRDGATTTFLEAALAEGRRYEEQVAQDLSSVVFEAEDRGLLPVNDARYDDYGLRKPVRDHVASRMAANDTFSTQAGTYYNHLTTLFSLIDKGDPSIGLPLTLPP